MLKLDSFDVNISVIRSFSSYGYNLDDPITLNLSAVKVALLLFKFAF